MLWSTNRIRKIICENEKCATQLYCQTKKMFFQSYNQLRLIKNLLNQKAKMTVICFGFNSTCKRGVEKYLETMSASSGREGEWNSTPCNRSLHSSLATEGPSKEGNRRFRNYGLYMSKRRSRAGCGHHSQRKAVMLRITEELRVIF